MSAEETGQAMVTSEESCVLIEGKKQKKLYSHVTKDHIKTYTSQVAGTTWQS